MAYVNQDLVLPSVSRPRPGILTELASACGTFAESLRKRWAYYRILSELEGYSERSLLDFGAHRGIEEFARRVAGL